MITRVLAVGLLAGLFAGLTVATLQSFTTTPIILAAEVFENAHKATPEEAAFGPSTNNLFTVSAPHLILVHGDAHDGGGSTQSNEEEWAPQDGMERTVFTSIATIATAVGFALIILAGMLFSNDAINERHAMIWAAAGFVAAGLAPAVGLSPELPGMAAANLAGRQEWWLATVLCTAAALWLFLRSDNNWLRLLAVPILLAPHIWGAPHLAEPLKSAVPAELAAQFAATSLAVQATLWILTGFFVGFLWHKLGQLNARPAA
ncbi:MAG: CbtA family protein [Hyphomicrobium sp.]